VAVAWAGLASPDCDTAYAFSKRALQATTMAAIDAAARLNRDLLSRGMSDFCKHSRPHPTLQGTERQERYLATARLGKVMSGAGRRTKITATPRRN
jgi:hypothetical protein